MIMIRIYFLARIMPADVEERQNNFKSYLCRTGTAIWILVANCVKYGTSLSAAYYGRCARFLDSHDVVRIGIRYLANNSTLDNLYNVALWSSLYKALLDKTSLIINN